MWKTRSENQKPLKREEYRWKTWRNELIAAAWSDSENCGRQWNEESERRRENICIGEYEEMTKPENRLSKWRMTKKTEETDGFGGEMACSKPLTQSWLGSENKWRAILSWLQ